MHAEVGHEYAERERNDGDQRTANVKQEDDANQRNDQALFNERSLERFERAINQVGPVIDRFDGHALRQARGNLREAVLYFLDDGERVFSEPLQCDARNDFAFAVHLGNAAALVGGELNSRHVPEQHRDAAVVLDDNLFEIGEALDVAAATYGELGLGQLHGSGRHPCCWYGPRRGF